MINTYTFIQAVMYNFTRPQNGKICLFLKHNEQILARVSIYLNILLV